MALDFRFAVISDLHIALPQTVWDHPSRFHLVEVSIPALESILAQLTQMPIDFLLLPGDLTQHGEPDNHQWLSNRLAQLPFPVYVVPGNHDVPHFKATSQSIGLADFTHYYQAFGYTDPSQLYYTHKILPGVRLIALNSNYFEPEQDTPVGYLDQAQLNWLKEVLAENQEEVILTMVHHNAVEHLRGQSQHPWGRRYMIRNASALLRLLKQSQAQLIFTGHLHIQNIAHRKGIYDITTGSLVSYPHPYRILHFQSTESGKYQLSIASRRVGSVPGFPDLQRASREWMGDRSQSAMEKFLHSSPLNLSLEKAQKLAPQLRYLWADIAAGDTVAHYPEFPFPARHFIESMSRSVFQDGSGLSDNCTTLSLSRS